MALGPFELTDLLRAQHGDDGTLPAGDERGMASNGPTPRMHTSPRMWIEQQFVFNAQGLFDLDVGQPPEWWLIAVTSGEVRVYNRSDPQGPFYDCYAGSYIRIPAQDQRLSILQVTTATGIAIAMTGYDPASIGLAGVPTGGGGTSPSSNNPYLGALTDRSGTITLGGTAQSLMAANLARRYLFVENLSVGDEWINFTVAAVLSQPSIRLVPGASFVMESSIVSSDALSIIGATTAQAFAAKEG